MKSLSDLQNLLSEEDKRKLQADKEERDKQSIETQKRLESSRVKEMNLEYFPAFIRMNYPELRGYSNKTLIDLGKEFKDYLHEVFKDDLKKGEAIWDIDVHTIVKSQLFDPFSINGYHPALIIHFGEFIERMKNDILKQSPK